MQWGAPAHQGLHVFFDLSGIDPDIEIIILGGTGESLIKSMGKTKLKKTEETQEFQS